jgi:2-haloacid dehalogenase
MKNNQIKTIIFDLGGVIFTNGTSVCIKKLMDVYNIKKVKDIIALRYFFSDDPESEGSLLRFGLISMNEFEERFYSKFNIVEKNKNYIRYIWFNSYNLQFMMEDIIKQLKDKYRLLIFSGNVKERVDFLNKRYDFLKYFDDAIFSFDYKRNKTDIEFYKDLLNRLKCQPSEAILIDDESKNIKIAKSLGLNAIYFCYLEQFIKELNNFGIKVSIEKLK